MKEVHRHFANEIRLVQPIAAYADADKAKNAALPWPADLICRYQGKIIDGVANATLTFEMGRTADF
jgi:hypothetical protein